MNDRIFKNCFASNFNATVELINAVLEASGESIDIG